MERAPCVRQTRWPPRVSSAEHPPASATSPRSVRAPVHRVHRTPRDPKAPFAAPRRAGTATQPMRASAWSGRARDARRATHRQAPRAVGQSPTAISPRPARGRALSVRRMRSRERGSCVDRRQVTATSRRRARGRARAARRMSCQHPVPCVGLQRVIATCRSPVPARAPLARQTPSRWPVRSAAPRREPATSRRRARGRAPPVLLTRSRRQDGSAGRRWESATSLSHATARTRTVLPILPAPEGRRAVQVPAAIATRPTSALGSPGPLRGARHGWRRETPSAAPRRASMASRRRPRRVTAPPPSAHGAPPETVRRSRVDVRSASRRAPTSPSARQDGCACAAVASHRWMREAL